MYQTHYTWLMYCPTIMIIVDLTIYTIEEITSFSFNYDTHDDVTVISLKFLHEMLILSSQCCLSLDLISLFELDMSSRQLACRCLPCGPSSRSTLSYTFPNLSHPFQFSDFNLSFSHTPWVILSIESADSHGFPHWRRHSKCVEDIVLKIIM